MTIMRQNFLRSFLLLATAASGVALVGCGNSTPPVRGDDAGVADLAQAPDLTPLADLAAPTGKKQGFIINAIHMPTSVSRYLYDVDGTGTPKNRLFDLNNVLNQFPSAAPQAAIDSALMNGSVLQVMQLQSTDAALKNDSHIGLGGYIGSLPAGTSALEAFSGTGTIGIDPTDEPALHNLFGAIIGGKLTTDRMPAGAFPIRFPLTTTMLPVPITLYGAAVKTTVMTAANGFQFVDGQLNGGLKSTDIHAKIIPAVAAMAQAFVDSDPTSNNAMQLLAMFKDPDPAKQGMITAAGVEANVLVQGLLAPDLDLFDGDGKLNPGKDGVADSLSFGIGFTAVSVTFPPQN